MKEPFDDPEELLTLDEAAEQYGVSLRQLRRRAAAGRLSGARRQGELWLVPRSSLESFVAPRQVRRGLGPSEPAPARPWAEESPPPASPTQAGRDDHDLVAASREAELAARERETLQREEQVARRETAAAALESALARRARDLQEREAALGSSPEMVSLADLERRERALAEESARLTSLRESLDTERAFVRAAQEQARAEARRLTAERARLTEQADEVARSRWALAEQTGRARVGGPVSDGA